MSGRKIYLIISALVALVVLVGCSGPSAAPPNAQKQAQKRAANRKNYIPVNDVEGQNYNARLRLADNPATLIWCTAFPTNPNAKPITVPIVGKLTSGNKRPYPTSQVLQFDTSGSYSPELPGPDGMYGTSGEYRYGFRPDGVYVDFYNLETYCTSAPSVYQKQSTTIDISSTGSDSGAEAALTACRKVNPDPSVPCAAAQAAIAKVGP
jgi:hypothetical protein